MPSEKATAIVLRTVDFSETSLDRHAVHAGVRKIGGLGKRGKTAEEPVRVCS